MLVYTFSHNENAPRLSELKKSAQRYGINLRILGHGVNRFNTTKKLDLLYEELCTLDDSEIVLAVDGFDVFFCSGAHEIESRFLAMDCDCVVSAERAYSHQYPRYRKFYESAAPEGPYRYLNSGSVIGYVWALKKIYKPTLSTKYQSRVFTGSTIRKIKQRSQKVADFLKLRDFDNGFIYSWVYYTDQQQIGKAVAKLSGKLNIRLDYETKLFWCCAFEWKDIENHYFLKNSKMVNSHTGNDPLVIHVPGWRVHRKVFSQLFNIQQDMKTTNVDLLLSTPDGIAKSLSAIWNSGLFMPVCPQKSDSDAASGTDRLHQAIMADHQKAWYQLCNKGFQLEDNLRYKNFVGEILQTLNQEKNPVIADPLLCFLAPLWKQQLNRPVLIFHYSNPMECALALQKTWRFPLQFGLALWEHYVLSALHQIRGEKYLLFSVDQYRKAPKQYFKSFADRYRKLKGIESGTEISFADSDFTALPPETDPNKEEFLGEAQKRIFTALESQDLESIRDVALSAQATDLLFHYGNLRSGFESIKSRISEPQPQVEVPSSAIEETQQPDNQPMTIDTDEPLVEVTVHIDGLPPQEFASSPDNPVLEVLNTALQNQSDRPNEMIYLQSAESETGAIYFSAGDLIAVETNYL